MPADDQLLFAVLAFEDELISLQQLTAACRAWADDKSRPIADQLVERGWVSVEDRVFIERKAQRKLSRHQNDPRVTLNAVARGDICDVLRKEVDDSDVRQSLSSWPEDAPVLLETIGHTLDESQQPKTRYTWISEVGAGGLGKVWLARDNDLSREVALKEIKPGSASSEAVRRLMKEAQITGQLQHPGIVPVYEVSNEGRPFYTMKLVKGETLRKAIEQHHKARASGSEDPLSARRLLTVFLSVCDAIAYAHSRGVIHRDLKPENIVLGEYGEAIVLDWGLARQVGSDDEEATPIVVTEEARTDATQAGQKLGTPAYMAPEQATGRVNQMDERTDTYGLGAILFEILTGQPPHRTDGESASAESDLDQKTASPLSPVAAMLHRIATEDATQARSIDDRIPEELNEICATALARQRDKRFQTALDLKAAVLDFQVHEESIDLAVRASQDLEFARQSSDYDDFSRARFSFEQALELWSQNSRAADGLRMARLEFARCAQSKGDFDLGMSLLDESDPDHASLHGELSSAKAKVLEREQQLIEQKAARTRLRRILTTTAVVGLVIVTGLAVYSELQRRDAVGQRTLAETNAKKAEDRRRDANNQRNKAEAARKLAERRRSQAESAREEKERAYETVAAERKRVAQELYFSRLRQAVGDIDAGRHTRAAATIARIPEAERTWEANYLARAALGTPLTIRAHEDRVFGVAFSPDGTRIVSCANDETIRVWDAESGNEVLRIRSGLGPEIFGAKITDVTFSPDGKRILSAEWDYTANVWNAETGEFLVTLEGHEGTVTCASFSPKGDRIVSGSEDKTVRIWDASTGEDLLTLSAHEEEVSCAEFSPDGKTIATGSADGTVRIWDAAMGTERLRFEHDFSVTDLSFDPSGRRIVSCGNPIEGTGLNHGDVIVWDASTGTELSRINAKMEGFKVFRSVDFSPDGRTILSGDLNGVVAHWDAETGRQLRSFHGHQRFTESVAFSPDGRRLVSAGGRDNQPGEIKVWDLEASSAGDLSLDLGSNLLADLDIDSNGSRIVVGASTAPEAPGVVKVLDLETGQEIKTLRGHSKMVVSATFGLNDGLIVSTSEDGTARLWNLETDEEVHRLDSPKRTVAAAFTPDGKYLVSGGEDWPLKIWNIETGAEVRKVFPRHLGDVTSVAVAPDGITVASGDRNGEVKLWDLQTDRTIDFFEMHGEVVNITFSRDGSRVAVCAIGEDDYSSSVIVVKDTKTWENVRTIFSNNSGVIRVEFTPDGAGLVGAGFDNALHFWHIESGTEALTISGYSAPVTAAAFTPDGRKVVTTDFGGTIRILDSLMPTTTKVVPMAGLGAYELGLSPDARRVICRAHEDGGYELWDTDSGERSELFVGTEREFRSLAFSPDGKHAVSTKFGENEITVWKTMLDRTPNLAAITHRISSHEDTVPCVAFSRNGSQFASASDDGTVKVWDSKTNEEVWTFSGLKGSPISVWFGPHGQLLMCDDGSDETHVWDIGVGVRYDGSPEPEPQLRKVSADGQTWLIAEGADLQIVRRNPDVDLWAEDARRRKAREPFLCERDATNSEQAQDWFAARFHLRRLSKLRPEEESVRNRLKNAETQLTISKGQRN